MNNLLSYSNIKNLLKLKFSSDVIWNLMSSTLLGVSGIIINIIILKYYHASGLGNFALALSIYMLLYLFTVFGISNSVIKYSSQYSDDKITVNKILSTAIIVVLVNSIIITVLAWLVSPFFKLVYKNIDFILIYKIFLLGLPIFSLNKILMSFLNGMRRMKPYAVYQITRFFLVVCIMFLTAKFYQKIELTAYAIPLTELILFIMLVFDTKLYTRLIIPKTFYWIKNHILFGIYTFLSEMFAEINLKIDNLLIAYFLNPAVLGIYVFASEIVKGLTLFAIAVQINFNPIISKLWSDNKTNDLKQYIRKIKKYTYLMYAPIIIISAIAYPIFIKYFVQKISSFENFAVFYILMVGVFIFSGYLALIGLLTFTGYIKYQFKRVLHTLLFNITGNLLLIPLFGIIGAAVSTSLSFIFTVFLIKYYSKNKISIKI